MNLKSFAIGTAAFLGSLIGLNVVLASKPKRNGKTMLTLPAAERNIGHDRQRIRWVVLHSTEGGSFPKQPSARGVASYFANPNIRDASGKPAPVSAHVIVDDNEIIRSVPDNREAYTVGKANPWTLNLEICGFRAWSREQWLSHRATIEAAAEVTAAWLVKHNLPTFLLEAGSRFNGDPFVLSAVSEGITTHEYVNQSYRASGINNGDHGDPGPNFPYDLFMGMVRDILDGPPEYLLNV